MKITGKPVLPWLSLRYFIFGHRPKRNPEGKIYQFIERIDTRIVFPVLQYFKLVQYGKVTCKVKLKKKEIYNLDRTLSVVIHALLVEYRKNINEKSYSYISMKDVPKHLFDALEKETDEAKREEIWLNIWKYAIDEMIFAFEYKSSQVEFEDIFSFRVKNNFIDNDIGTRLLHKRVNRGMDLFARYFHSLWL